MIKPLDPSGYFDIWLWKITILLGISTINKRCSTAISFYYRIDMGALRITNTEAPCFVLCRMMFLFEIVFSHCWIPCKLQAVYGPKMPTDEDVHCFCGEVNYFEPFPVRGLHVLVSN